MGATFVLLHTTQEKEAQGAETLKFFGWAFKNGTQAANELETQWKAKVKDASGKAVVQ